MVYLYIDQVHVIDVFMSHLACGKMLCFQSFRTALRCKKIPDTS